MKTKRLDQFHPCSEAREWMKTQKNATEAWNNCERGDWMLWVAARLGVDNRKLIVAKAMCAKQVEHLMVDQRSRDAIQACIDYYNCLITREQLNTYAAAAADAADADAAAAYAAYAADAAYTAAAAYAAYAADAYAAYAAARMSSLKKSADICREYLTDEVMTKYKKL
jgi:hypothetical protein